MMAHDEFWKTMIKDEPNLLERVIELLTENEIMYCVIGGQAVSAYVEPVISLDLDLAVAMDQVNLAKSLFEELFAPCHIAPARQSQVSQEEWCPLSFLS